MDERDETRRTDRRDFLRKLGMGAAVVAAPVTLSACHNPYLWPKK